MRTKKFIAQMGPNHTVKVFDAHTGSLYKIINAGGEIVSQPLVVENELSVVVKSAGCNLMKVFSLPSGSLKKTTTIG